MIAPTQDDLKTSDAIRGYLMRTRETGEDLLGLSQAPGSDSSILTVRHLHILTEDLARILPSQLRLPPGEAAGVPQNFNYQNMAWSLITRMIHALCEAADLALPRRAAYLLRGDVTALATATFATPFQSMAMSLPRPTALVIANLVVSILYDRGRLNTNPLFVCKNTAYRLHNIRTDNEQITITRIALR